MNQTTQYVAVMFADLKGYSGLPSDKHKVEAFKFLYQIVQRVSAGKLFIMDSNTNIVTNTWGDAMLLVDNSCVELAKIALTIRDEVRKTDWKGNMFPDDLRIRIGLNFGTAEVLKDEAGKTINVIGKTVDTGARLEPVAEVDSVYASEDFYFQIKNETTIKGEPKQVTLPKDAGELLAYKLLWNWEQGTNAPQNNTSNPTPKSMNLDDIKKLIKTAPLSDVFETLDKYEHKFSDLFMYNQIKNDFASDALGFFEGRIRERLSVFVGKNLA